MSGFPLPDRDFSRLRHQTQDHVAMSLIQICSKGHRDRINVESKVRLFRYRTEVLKPIMNKAKGIETAFFKVQDLPYDLLTGTHSFAAYRRPQLQKRVQIRLDGWFFSKADTCRQRSTSNSVDTNPAWEALLPTI